MKSLLRAAALWGTGLCLAYLAAQDLGDRQLEQFEVTEWTVQNPSQPADPFTLLPEISFRHQASGLTRVGRGFYHGGNNWTFRFYGELQGTWTFVTSSDDADLDGFTGSISVIPNSDAEKRGRLGGVGTFWTVDGVDGTPEAFNFHSFVSSGQPIPTRISRSLDFGFAATMYAGGTLAANDKGTISLNTWQEFEQELAQFWENNLYVHGWNFRGSSTHIYYNKRFYNYFVARMNAFPNYVYGPGWDPGGPHFVKPFDWAHSPHAFLQRNLAAWEPMFWIRNNTSVGLPVLSNDVSSPYRTPSGDKEGPRSVYGSPETVGWWFTQNYPNRVHLYERRWWPMDDAGGMRDGMTEEQVVRLLWAATIVGGQATSIGDSINEGSNDRPIYHRMINPQRWSLHRRFWHTDQHLRLDVKPLGLVNNQWLMSNETGAHQIIWKPESDSIAVDIPAGQVLQAKALDVMGFSYDLIDFGTLSPGSHQLNLPHESHWIIALGDFSTKPHFGILDAGPERRIVIDSDGNGSAGVDVSAKLSRGVSNIVWEWHGGSATGETATLNLPLGETVITVSGQDLDSTVSTTIAIKVISPDDDGAHAVGGHVWLEAESAVVTNVGSGIIRVRDWGGNKTRPPASGLQVLEFPKLSGDIIADPAEASRARLSFYADSSVSYRVFIRSVFGNEIYLSINESVAEIVSLRSPTGNRAQDDGWVELPGLYDFQAGLNTIDLIRGTGKIDVVYLIPEDSDYDDLPYMTLPGATPQAAEDHSGTGGGGGGGEPNTPPVITAISANPPTVSGTNSQLNVSATDADDDTLTYSWQVTTKPAGANPSIGLGDNPTVTFDMAGDYMFSVTVEDGRGGNDIDSVNLSVAQTPSNLGINP